MLLLVLKIFLFYDLYILYLIFLYFVKDAFTMVDELCDFSPPLKKDEFFDVWDVDIRYTAESEDYQFSHLMPSAIRKYVLRLYVSTPTDLQETGHPHRNLSSHPIWGVISLKNSTPPNQALLTHRLSKVVILISQNVVRRSTMAHSHNGFGLLPP